MYSSFYTHIILLFSCVLFLSSLSFFLIRLEIHFNLIKFIQIFFICNHYSIQTNNLIIKKNNEISFEEKSYSKFDSVFNRFEFVNPSKSICNNLENPNNSLIIIILSRAFNLDHRQAIRATWGRNYQYKPSNITVQTIFFVGIDDSLESSIKIEQTLFNDVVEINIPEKRSFIAYKELAALFWLRLYCPSVRLLFRIDDDMLLDIFLLTNHIEHEIDLNKQDGIYGWFRINKPVLRTGNWAVTKSEYKKDIYPPYSLTIGYLFSNNTCHQLVQVANHSKHHVNRISDAYITGILRESAQIQYYQYSKLGYAILYSTKDSCKEQFAKRTQLLVCTSRLHLNIRDNPNEYYDIWKTSLNKYDRSLLNFQK